MAKLLAKCKYCGIQFDRSIEPYVEAGARRYAHKACAEKHDAAIPQEEKDYIKLEEYIKKLFHEPNLNIRIRRQIRDFRQEYNYTYSGMMKTLYWWYEIKGHTISEAQGGIGIIPYVYQDALKYYYSIHLATLANENFNSEHIVKEVEITSPRAKTNPIKMFNLDDE